MEQASLPNALAIGSASLGPLTGKCLRAEPVGCRTNARLDSSSSVRSDSLRSARVLVADWSVNL